MHLNLKSDCDEKKFCGEWKGNNKVTSKPGNLINHKSSDVVTLASEHMDTGTYSLSWDATNISAGYYRAIANFIDRQCFVNLHLQSNN